MPKGVPSETGEAKKPDHELDEEELKTAVDQILKKDGRAWSSFEKNDCLLSTYAPPKDGGENQYRQARIKGVKYYVHRISAWYKVRSKYAKIPDANWEVSHLCHKRACYNPKHLEFEDGLHNKSRICCELFKDTQGYYCPHKPPCFGTTPCNS
jgi:hypothetical protein